MHSSTWFVLMNTNTKALLDNQQYLKTVYVLYVWNIQLPLHKCVLRTFCRIDKSTSYRSTYQLPCTCISHNGFVPGIQHLVSNTFIKPMTAAWMKLTTYRKIIIYKSPFYDEDIWTQQQSVSKELTTMIEKPDKQLMTPGSHVLIFSLCRNKY